MNGGKKPEPIKRKTVRLKGLAFVKRKEDRKRMNEELEFLIEMEDRMPRKEEKRDYDLDELVEEIVDRVMAELKSASTRRAGNLRKVLPDFQEDEFKSN
jgi:hypothetical protein